MSLELSALVLAWIAIVLLAFAMSGLVRQVRAFEKALALRRATVGPALGSAAAPVEGVALSTPALLLFADTECSACASALQELADEAATDNGLDYVVLFRETGNGFRSPSVTILQDQKGAFAEYRVPITPFAVAISGQGTIADTAAVGKSLSMMEFIGRAKRREGS